VVFSRLAQLRLRINGFDAQEFHQPRYALAVHWIASVTSHSVIFSTPIERRPRVLLVQQPHEPEVLFVLTRRLVVQPGAIDAQQLALPPDAEVRMAPFHQCTKIF